MKKLKSITSIFALLLIAFTSIYAQPMKREKPMKGDNFFNLNLTEEQQSKFDEIRFANSEKMIDIKSELQKNKLAMKKLISNKDFSTDDLTSLVKKENDLEGQMKLARTDMWVKIYKILNPEQKEIWIKHLNFRQREKMRTSMRDGMMREKRMMERREHLQD